MKIKLLFILAGIGIILGIISVIVYNEKIKSEPPVSVSYNPYTAGIYATGIIESHQLNGSNINIYPEVAGRVTKVFVKDNVTIKKDSPIFAIDDSVQKEIVAKDEGSIRYASANLINVEQQFEKINKSFLLNPKSISKNTLDNAINAVKIAKENLAVAQMQYRADFALWQKYIVKAPRSGIILRVVVSEGDYASPQGSFDPYTQAMLPAIQMGLQSKYLQVRCYVDEILTPRLPLLSKVDATMFIRGLTNYGIPLEYVGIQPFTIPNIQLSDERNERVDVRVLPIIFKFPKPKDINIFPGQLVDIYLKGKQDEQTT